MNEKWDMMKRAKMEELARQKPEPGKLTKQVNTTTMI